MYTSEASTWSRSLKVIAVQSADGGMQWRVGEDETREAFHKDLRFEKLASGQWTSACRYAPRPKELHK
jgi:hypothetical protein